jgi:drug/metabolite transporter (DMT)-like permease
MAGTMFFWGVSFVASKIVLDHIGPISYMGIRFFLAGTVLALVMLFLRRPRFSRRTHGLIALTALAEPIAYFLFESYGLSMIGATTTSLVIALVPLAVMLMAALFLHEPLHARGLMAVGISIAGIALLVYGRDLFAQTAAPTDTGLDPAQRTLGVLLILGAVFSAAGYITLARSLTQKFNPVTLTIFQTWWGALFFVILWQVTSPGMGTVRGLSGMVWGAIAFLVLGATVAAFLLYNWALKYEEAGTAALYINAIPVITAITAWFVLGETLEPVQFVGALLVLAAVRLSSKKSRIVTAETIPPELS